jgi:hypothetical protein
VLRLPGGTARGPGRRADDHLPGTVRLVDP